MIEIEVSKASAVYIDGRETLTSGRVGLKVKLVFSGDWQGLIKTAVCIGSGTTLGTVVASDGTFTVPHECMAEAGGQLKIGVCGMNADGTVVIPTVYCALGVIEEGAIPSGETGEEPTPSAFNQLMAIANEAIDKAKTVRDEAASSAQAANTAATQAAAYKYDPNTYEGVDLTVQFAEEIKKYTDAWAWIKARIQAGNYTDLHVGDYIPFVTTNGVSFKAQIAGMDTYTTGGYPAIGHHIDFICDKEWLTAHAYNKVNFNNGTAAVPYPWLASDLYHYCNSLSGTVPNASVVGGGDGEAVDYTTDGIYYYLPDALKAVIIQKRTMLPKRYSASGLLLNDNGWGLENAGYLWLPTEWEVYGGAVWGNTGYGTGGIAVQYPLFAHNMKWVRYGSVARTQSWLLSACAGSTSNVAAINYAGAASYTGAPNTAFYVLVCFRVG
jgi:hypothetical protein